MEINHALREFQEHGCQESAAFLIKTYTPLMRNIAYMPLQAIGNKGYTTPKSEREDMYHEMVCCFLESIGKFDESKSHFSHYIKSKLRWHAYTFVKKNKLDYYQHEILDDKIDFFIEEEPTLEGEFLKELSYDLIDQTEGLKTRQRQVMDLYRVGVPLKQIGRELGIDPRVAQRHKELAIKKLRKKNNPF